MKANPNNHLMEFKSKILLNLVNSSLVDQNFTCKGILKVSLIFCIPLGTT